MKRRFKTLAILSLACLAILLSAGVLFNWLLKRDDDKLKKQLAKLTAADDKPSLLEVKVATPEDLLSALETPDRFRIMYRISDIPNSVKIAFAKATQRSTQEEVFLMAEPGSWPWNTTDVILDGLPRRLGFAKTDDIAAFRLSGNGAHAIWHSSLAPGVANPADLRNAIRGQAYGDERY